jgi:hypothetical protein
MKKGKRFPQQNENFRVRRIVEKSSKTDISVEKEIGNWELEIVNTIYKYFSQNPFCCYDVVKKILGSDIKDRMEFYKWAMRVRKILRILEKNGKIRFVGWEEGVAPVNKKMYEVVR